MTSWHEIELKLALPDEDAWHWVRERLLEPRTALQSNHFFDSSDGSLRAARIGVRLRREPEGFLLTVKSDGLSETEGSLSRRIELEAPLSAEKFASALIDGLLLTPWICEWRERLDLASGEVSELRAFLSRLTALAPERLQLLGGFENERTTGEVQLNLPRGPLSIEVELDRTHFPGGRTDFELEVEFPAADSSPSAPKEEEREALPREVHRALVLWLEGGDIHPFEASSKLARFQAILESEAVRSSSND